MNQDDITVGNRIAVWIGSFTDDSQVDDYLNLDRGFERDFGFLIADDRGPEVAVVSTPVPIRQLVDRFSCSADYADAAIAAAESAGIIFASTMVLFHWVEFDPKVSQTNPHAPLLFLGNFNFKGFK